MVTLGGEMGRYLMRERLIGNQETMREKDMKRSQEEEVRELSQT